MRKKIDLQKVVEEYLENPTNDKIGLIHSNLDKRIKKFIYYRLKKYYSYDGGILIDMTADIASEVFLRAFENINKYHTAWKFTTWIYSIAQNCTFNYIADQRKLNKIRYKSADSLHHTKIYDEEGHADYVAEENSDINERREFFLNLETDIYNLPEMYRDIFIDREFNKLSYNELCDKYDLPMQTIKNRLHHAKLKLKKTHENTYKELFID